jgi:hypothetical protein
MNGNSPGSFPMADLGIRGVSLSGYVNRELNVLLL